MTAIQKTIKCYMAGKKEPGLFDMECFVGMIQTGKATLADFEAVGGQNLAAAVAKSLEHVEDVE